MSREVSRRARKPNGDRDFRSECFGTPLAPQMAPHICPDIVRTVVRLAAMTEPASKAPRRQRLEMRVTPQQDAVIRQAARLENTTITAFVLDTVTARAHKVIRKHADLVLSNDAFDRFLAELDKPAQVVPELAKLFERKPKLPEG